MAEPIMPSPAPIALSPIADQFILSNYKFVKGIANHFANASYQMFYKTPEGHDTGLPSTQNVKNVQTQKDYNLIQ